MRVQLITFPGCPNAAAARAVLERVLAATGADDRIEEVDSTAPETAEHLREWGSPTILLDGADVGGEPAPTGRSCRLYRDNVGKVHGAPPESLLLAAMQRAMSRA